MCYKNIVNELDNFLKRKSALKLGCVGCPLLANLIDDIFNIRRKFDIESKCIITFFYSIKEILSEDKINFLLEKLKENNIQYINCDNYEDALSFLKVLKSVCNLL